MRLPLAALLVVLAVACRGAPPPEHLQAGRMGSVLLLRPSGEPAGLVFLFSDAGGWSKAFERAARELRARGAAVVGVDLPGYLAALRASDDGCHYLVSEIEDLSKRVQSDLDSARYQSPILAGVGEGGLLAYAALAQAPAATVAGAVAVDPSASLDTRVPLCPGAASRPVPGGGFAYAARSGPELPGFYRVAAASPAGATAELVAQVTPELSAPAAGPLAGIPLVELPAAAGVARPGPWMAVLYSGDGGWRDLDKTVAEALARRGVPVVGVDSLRYFWRTKTPDQVAADLSRILRHYGKRWDARHVALIGYSFGAGVLPFAMNRLPAAEREQVAQLTLLGLDPRAPFHFQVTDWLQGVGADPYRDAPLVLPELERIDPALVQCVYGEEETDTLCTAPELARCERIRTRGGHHFDGDYEALAGRILDGLRRRTGAHVSHAT